MGTIKNKMSRALGSDALHTSAVTDARFVRGALWLLVLGPWFGITLLSYDAWRHAQRMSFAAEEVQTLTDIASEISGLVRSVELERGLVFSGIGSDPAGERDIQDGLARLEALVARSMPDEKGRVDEIRKLREVAVQICLSSEEQRFGCFSAHSNVVGQLISLAEAAQSGTMSQMAGVLYLRYVAVLLEREAMATVRGLGARLPGADTDVGNLVRYFDIAVIKLQDSRRLRKVLGGHDIPEFPAVDYSEEAQSLIEGGASQATSWFEKMTAGVDALYRVEQELLRELADEALGKSTAARKRFRNIAVLFVLFGVAGLMVGVATVTRVNRQYSTTRNLLSARSELLDELEQTQHELSGIISIADDAIVSVDDQHRIVRYNLGAEKIFGFGYDEVVGQDLSVLLPEDVRKGHPEHLRKFAKAPEVSRLMRSRNAVFGRRKDGKLFPARASISKLETSRGIIFTAILRDESEIVAAMDEIESYSQRLEEMNSGLRAAVKSRNQLLGMAAHDLRNPLTVIKASAAFLSSPAFGTRERDEADLLDRISGASEFMLKLIEDVLDISVIESGELRLERQPTVLNDIVLEVVDIMGPAAELKGISISVDLDDRLPKISIDGSKISQVLQNLISNAVKYSEPKTRVIVKTEKSDRGVMFSVKDEGLGIPEVELGNLFKPFGKLSPRPTGGERSTGLGLAIVHRIVSEHGAEVEVVSKAGQGSTFSIRFPVDSTKD